jgi:hypothetical protein
MGAPVGIIVTLSCGHRTLADSCAMRVALFGTVITCQSCEWFKQV